MKDFMLIFLGADYAEAGLSPEQLQDKMNKWFSWHGKLAEKGILGGGEALQPQAKRIYGTGDLVVADGPFVETKELIGGYFVVKAASMEEAVEISRDYPDFDLGGSVEVREVMVFEQ